MHFKKSIDFNKLLLISIVAIIMFSKMSVGLVSRQRFLSGKYYFPLLRFSFSSKLRNPLSEGAGENNNNNEDVPFTEFNALGLNPSILQALASQNLVKPTAVQKAVIPSLLNRENIVMAASTGSGKTLAYSLPTIQNLQIEEELGYNRRIKRPRCLILVPTRELAKQVLQAIKQIGYFSKISATSIVGGEQYALQKKSLDRLVDIVVASPGRLMQHKEQGNVFLSHVNTVIIDEVDTMLMQGFGSDIRAILRSSLKKKAPLPPGNETITAAADDSFVNNDVQVIMATATLTKAVKALLDDVNGNGFNIEFSDPTNKTPRKLLGNEERVEMRIVEVDGVHRSLPHVKHLFEETKGVDKLSLLKNILTRNNGKMKRTLIFCNTVDSCRAAEYSINEDPKIKAVSYHGDLNSKEREFNLAAFRAGEEALMVCTDIAARGLDIPDIDHVIIFDFPLNPVDYIHRAGRCGRAGRKGTVTSLITKRDEVLAEAIQGAISRGLPIDSLSSSKRDYNNGGMLAHVMGRKATTSGVAKASKSRKSSPAAVGNRDSGKSTKFDLAAKAKRAPLSGRPSERVSSGSKSLSRSSGNKFQGSSGQKFSSGPRSKQSSPFRRSK